MEKLSKVGDNRVVDFVPRQRTFCVIGIDTQTASGEDSQLSAAPSEVSTVAHFSLDSAPYYDRRLLI